MRATRRGLLALGAASVVAPPPALAQGRSDVDVLEELYALEAQLADGYQAALRRGALPEAVARRLLAQEREHARGLERALTARGRAEPPARPNLPRSSAAPYGTAPGWSATCSSWRHAPSGPTRTPPRACGTRACASRWAPSWAARPSTRSP